jgi:hypothetical protein
MVSWKFEKGSGSLYNGTAEADVSINLPVVDFFSVNVKFHSIDSKSAFKLIGWDPGIPAGNVDGSSLLQAENLTLTGGLPTILS